MTNKRYLKYSVANDASIFSGYVEDYAVSESLIKKLSKDLGMSLELYSSIVAGCGKEVAWKVISAMSSKSYPEIVLLLDDEEKIVVDYSLDSERLPILNDEFSKRLNSLAESSEAIELGEVYVDSKDTIASVILKRKSPIIIEEKFENKPSNFIEYSIGVLVTNDETNSAYSRLVLYVNDQPLYLPASYYSTTTSRYRRSTSSSVEALEVLVLKAIDDLRDDALMSKMKDFHYRYRANKHVLASYEEYNSVLRTMRRIPTIIEDNSFIESLLSKYEDFEMKYAALEDKKSSYVWRCTAMSDISIGALVSMTSRILSDLGASASEYAAIRDLLGSYISTSRIAEEIAAE